jgi:hypothetical protein
MSCPFQSCLSAAVVYLAADLTPIEKLMLVLRAKSQIIGVSGLYRQPDTPSHLCWLGWFAIRPQFRR